MRERQEARVKELAAEIERTDKALNEGMAQRNMLHGALLEAQRVLKELTDASDIQHRPDESH